MIETTQVEAPGETPPATRMHKIVLCCAQSVQGMVAEVARNLQGLGFSSEVVCGAEARSALLGRERTSNEPTIYVVCVQGSLKDAVLKPLRQALATHGGPNEHLFVAVLDLSLPLAMVGQIRRFAEALERLPGGHAPNRREPLGERRQWRENLGHHELDRVQTRTYRSLQVVPRGQARIEAPPREGTGSLSRSGTITGPRTIEGHRRPAKVQATQKYRAVTGPLPPAERKRRPRRRGGARRRPAARGAKRIAPDVVTRTVTESGANPVSPDVAPRRPVAAPQFEHFAEPSSKKGWWVLVGVLALAGLSYTGWRMHWFRAARTGPSEVPVAAHVGPDRGSPTAAPEPNEKHDQAPPRGDAPPRDEPPPAVPDEAAPDEAPTAPDDASTAKVEGEAAPDDAAPAPDDDTPSDDEPSDAASAGDRASPSGTEAILADALAHHRIRDCDTMWVTPKLEKQESWNGARQACSAIEIDGVAGWRLPFRRELKLLGAIGLLGPEHWWSRTSDDYDRQFAFIYDGTEHRLVPWLKTESQVSVVCIRDKKK